MPLSGIVFQGNVNRTFKSFPLRSRAKRYCLPQGLWIFHFRVIKNQFEVRSVVVDMLGISVGQFSAVI
jgi:hypothetical protein